MDIKCSRYRDGIFKCDCRDCEIRREKVYHKDALFKLELQELRAKGYSEEKIGSIEDANSIRSKIARRIYSKDSLPNLIAKRKKKVTDSGTLKD